MLLDLSWHGVTEQRCSLHSYAPFSPRLLMNITGWFTEELKMLSHGIHSHPWFPRRVMIPKEFSFTGLSLCRVSMLEPCNTKWDVLAWPFLCYFVCEWDQSERTKRSHRIPVSQTSLLYTSSNQWQSSVSLQEAVGCVCHQDCPTYKAVDTESKLLLFRKIIFFRTSAELTFNALLISGLRWRWNVT